MKSYVLGFALLSATAIVASAPAQAQNGTLTRSFVSSAGLDSNACTITAPCASFAVAYTKIGANGIIAALDPGKYGPIAITTGVTINGNGWSAITAPAQGNGITINAGSSNVTLIGLEIDGAQAGYNGIVLNSAGNLTITDCNLQNFAYSGSGFNSGNGILMQPTDGTLNFTITGTTASNNGYGGILYELENGMPNANGIIDHVIANANLHGIVVRLSFAQAGTTIVSVSNSIIAGNSQDGVEVDNSGAPTTVKVSIDNIHVAANFIGVAAYGNPDVLLGRSVITGNSIGVIDDTSNTFFTFGDNRLNGNATDGYSTLNTSFTTH